VHTVTVWEPLRKLLGYENLCLKLYDDPALVDEAARRVGEYYLALTRGLSSFKCIFTIYGSDDFGYKTATMVSPDVLRQTILPWHKRTASCAHAQGKFYFLHACGRNDAIMDDLIDDVKIDAKHSFEDNIHPVTEAKALWGERITLLGGLDVDFIARATEAEIRERVRQTLDACLPGGGYCLGLGNWVTSCIPLDNYLTVLDEGRRYG
jgi:uroporphyrinogen decarboxylase